MRRACVTEDDGAPGADTQPLLAGLAYAAVFCALVSAVLTALVTGARSGLGSPPALVIACPLLLAAAAFAPFLLPARWRPCFDAAPFVFPLASLAVLLSPILVFLTARSLIVLYPALVVLGVRGALPFLRRLRRRDVVGLALGAALLGVYLFAQLYRRPYAHVFAPELSLLGFASLDTLLHLSIAHMIEGFGQASTGFDGLVPTHYHVGSHYWFAAVAALTGTEPRFAYPFGQYIVTVPALFLGVFSSALYLMGTRARGPVALTLAIGVVVFFDILGWRSHYISESQTFALIVVLLTQPLLLDVAAHPRRSVWVDWVRLAALLSSVWIAMVMKLSAGTILAAGVVYVALRRYGLTPRTCTIGGILALIGVYARLYVQPSPGRSLAVMWSPLHLFRNTPSWESPYGPAVTFVLPGIFLLWALGRRMTRHAARGEVANRDGPDENLGSCPLAVELVLVTTIVAALPGLTLDVGPGAWWFANTAQWFVLPIVVARAGQWEPRAALRWAVTRTGAVLLVALAIYSMRNLEPDLFARLAATVVERAVTTENSGADTIARRGIWHYMRASLRDHGTLFPPEVRAAVADSEGARIIRLVDAAQTSSVRERLIVYVPPTNVAYWLRQVPVAAFSRPFFIPALAGVPLLKGVRWFGPRAQKLLWYGYADYGDASRLTALTDDEVCAHAATRGFGRALVLQSVDVPARNRLLDCTPPNGA